EPAGRGEHRAGHDDGEPAQPGHHFEHGVLARELAEERQAQMDVALGQPVELVAARGLLLEGDGLPPAPHRIDGAGAEPAGTRAPAASRAWLPSRSTRLRIRNGFRPRASRKGSSASASQPLAEASTTITTAGTSMATKAGATVWAKKYSTSSMSCVASAIRSP